MCFVFDTLKSIIPGTRLDRIQQVLAADHANARVSPKLMELLDPLAVKAFQATADLYRLLFRRQESSAAEEAEEDKLRQIANANGLSDQQLVELLQAGGAGHLDGAVDAYARLWALRVAKILVLLCQRYWTWAATDLHRLRITPALGYLRLQAECLGVIALFLQEPSLAEKWANIRDRQSGQAFFRDTQSRLKEGLREFDLDRTYDIASGGAQHVRMASFVRSLMSGGGELRLPDQDFNRDDPYTFHLAVAYFHRIQARILPALANVLPDVRDAEWQEKETAYVQQVARLWSILETRYSDRIAEENSETP